jgi:hypothetical protein
MPSDELEHRRSQTRRADELLQESRRAKEMIKAGDLTGAAEILAETAQELGRMLIEEIERQQRR